MASRHQSIIAIAYLKFCKNTASLINHVFFLHPSEQLLPECTGIRLIFYAYIIYCTGIYCQNVAVRNSLGRCTPKTHSEILARKFYLLSL
jgi:hypothetical protein